MKYNPQDNFVRLPFQNTTNLRDLGGYPADNGKATLFHRFLRGGDMHELSDKEIDFLYAYGVRNIIDLRGTDEQSTRPNPFENERFTLYNIPFAVGNIIELAYEYDNPNALYDMYIYLLKNNTSSIFEVFNTIANAPTGGILYHCSAGKDRTGLISAFLLSLVGVDEKDIVANYRISETYYVPYMQSQYEDKMDEIPIAYLLSGSKTMIATLECIKKHFGTVEAYLLSVGNTKEALDIVRKRIINTVY